MGRRGTFAVAKSLLYVSKDDKVLTNSDGSNVVFTHNIFGKNLSEVEREFLNVSARRQHHRSNNLDLTHFILAFNPKNNGDLDAAKLEDLTRTFFKLNNPNALYYATVHKNTDNFHVHCIVSPVDIMGNSTRKDKENFQSLKISLQEYQRLTYPELEASIVEHGAERKEYSKPDYWQKDGSIPDKERLRESLSAAFELSHNRHEFLDLIHADGLTTYERGGNIVGVVQDRNYRFKTLDIDLELLDERERKLNDLVELTEGKELDAEIEENVNRQEIQDENKEEELSEEEKRMRELDELSER